MAQQFDDAVAAFGGSDWVYTWPLESPDVRRKTEGDIDNPISILTFQSAALRPPGNVRTVWAATQVLHNVPEFGNLTAVGEAIKQKRYGELPDVLRPADGVAMPDGANLGVVICNKNDGTMDIVKTLLFEKPVHITVAKKVLPGEMMVPVYRPGPWAVKKAYHALLDRVPGYHVSWASVTPRSQGLQRSRSASSVWTATDDEIDAGTDFIIQFCPVDEAESAMTTWIWKKIRSESGTPIAGWPEIKARKIAENKKKASQGVPAFFFFPLLLFDMAPMWHQLLLPLMIPLFTESGLLLLGLPGVGKTPTVAIISMTMGRMLVRQGRTGEAGWRRGKCWDDFKDRLSVLGIAAFLDDPMLFNICWGDLKKFLCVSDGGSTTARYNNAGFVENQFRAVADNEFDPESEPPSDGRTYIEPEEFMKMMVKPFGGHTDLHVLACLKRCVTCVAGEHGFYLRFPSKRKDATIHRIDDPAMMHDWLEGNKEYYGQWLNNTKSRETPLDFEDRLADETKLVDKALAKRAEFKITEDYIQMCNDAVQKALVEKRVAEMPGVRPVQGHIPASPEDENATVVAPSTDGTYAIPIPRISAATSSKRSRFQIPDQRTRMRQKTSPLKAAAPQPSGASSSSSAVPPAMPTVLELDLEDALNLGASLDEP